MSIFQHENLIIEGKTQLYRSSRHFSHYPESFLKVSFEEEVKSLEDLATERVATSRKEFFKIPGASSTDYLERCIEVESREGEYVIAGIRFRNLNPQRPFVSIIPSFTEYREDCLLNLSKQLEKEFKVFNPESFNFTVPADVELKFPNLMADRFTVVGNLRQFKPPQSALNLEPIETIDFYQEYVKEYEFLYKNNPDLMGEVRIEEIESLNEAGKLGLLFKLKVNGETAGLIAGYEQDYYGFKAVCILEEIIFSKYRGKGLGTDLQKSFVQHLKDRYDLIWGHISNLNPASLKTALKTGRIISEVEHKFLFNS